MKWFGNRNLEGHEAETADVKPKNQILQVPEKESPQDKRKLDLFQNKSPEEREKSLKDQSEVAKNFSQKKNSSENIYKEEKQRIPWER